MTDGDVDAGAGDYHNELALVVEAWVLLRGIRDGNGCQGRIEGGGWFELTGYSVVLIKD